MSFKTCTVELDGVSMPLLLDTAAAVSLLNSDGRLQGGSATPWCGARHRLLNKSILWERGRP